MKYLTLEEVAAQLHWSPGTARNRISRGDAMPPYFKIGHRLLFIEAELQKWVEEQRGLASSQRLVTAQEKSELCRGRLRKTKPGRHP